jgi:hypothetical protein
MEPTVERGFEYFPSPDTDGDHERIFYTFFYCSKAVRSWPRFRRRLIKAALKSTEQCDHIEAHVISVFREMRDAILRAMETGDSETMKEPRLLERFECANALLALFANPGSMAEYRDMILGGSGKQPDQGDFNRSIWGAAWDRSEGAMAAQVTRAEAMDHGHLRDMDGRYNSRRTLDSVATASAIKGAARGPAHLSEEKSQLIEREMESLILKLRAAAKRAHLKPSQIEFLVAMAVRGKQQKDNPTAWRAIRDRKCAALYLEISRLVDSIRALRESFITT